MKYLIALITFMSLVGCGNRAELLGKEMSELANNCAGPVQASLTISRWNESFTVTCTNYTEFTKTPK